MPISLHTFLPSANTSTHLPIPTSSPTRPLAKLALATLILPTTPTHALELFETLQSGTNTLITLIFLTIALWFFCVLTSLCCCLCIRTAKLPKQD